MEEFNRRGGFGQTLKSAREAAGIDLHDLANTTKIQTRYIEALETETWAKVPGGVIGRGFVRLIAREVGADPVKLIELYNHSRGEELPATRAAPPDTQWKSSTVVPKLKPQMLLALLGLVVVIVLAVFGYRYVQSKREAAKPQEIVIHRLEVKALQDTWVKISAKGVSPDKTPLAANETISFDVEDAVIEVPDATAVEVVWDGAALKEEAKPGEAALIKLPRELENQKP